MKQLESVSIRRAKKGDLDSLKDIQQLAYARSYGDSSLVEDLEGLFDRRRVFIYVAELEVPFGYVAAGEPREDLFKDADTGEIIDLCIDPDYWGHGYGRKLLVHGVSILRRHNLGKAIVWTREGAERTKQVVESLHFQFSDTQRTTNRKGIEVNEDCYELDIASYF